MASSVARKEEVHVLLDFLIMITARVCHSFTKHCALF